MKLVMSKIEDRILIENARTKEDYKVIFNDMGDLMLVKIKEKNIIDGVMQEIKKITLIGIVIMMLALFIIPASAIIPTLIKPKLKNYADINFKQAINYKNVSIDSISTQGNFTIIKLNADGKKIRWITTTKNFNKITT